jgi:hypothetical protein
MIEDIETDYKVAEDDKYLSMHLQEDIYGLTYASFMATTDPTVHRNLMLKSTLTITLQVVLIVIVIES